MFWNHIYIIVTSLKMVQCQFHGHIVEGDITEIGKFPHSAFMAVECHNSYGNIENWVCGGSIINQQIILTAAHCVAGCTKYSDIPIMTGHENNRLGFRSSTHSFTIHGQYDDIDTINDIGLLRMRTPIKFGLNVKRVALLKNPPSKNVAFVAGWGLIDETYFLYDENLRYLTQRIWAPEKCKSKITHLANGCFCGKNDDKTRYVSYGDSGGALMVNNYIQIGIVSYKIPKVANDLIVYTNVTYYYNWIKQTSRLLACKVLRQANRQTVVLSYP